MTPTAEFPAPTLPRNRRMRAAVLYGPEDIRMEEVPISAPGPGEVLVRVDVASVDFTDRKVFLRGSHPMIKTPGVFGHEWAGTIVEVGPDPGGRWRPGQRVAAANSAPCLAVEGPVCRQCRRGCPSMCETIQYLNGAFAPYILVPRRLARVNLHAVPEDTNLERVVFTEPYACVVQAVRRIPVTPGDVVVVFGAGPMGLFMVNALRRRYGKDCVIVSLDRLDSRLRVAEAMGATHALNTTDRSSREALQTAIGRPDADVVIEVIGAVETHREALGLVGRGGALVLSVGWPRDRPWRWTSAICTTTRSPSSRSTTTRLWTWRNRSGSSSPAKCPSGISSRDAFHVGAPHRPPDGGRPHDPADDPLPDR